jgi:hypothetical protein
MKKTVNAYLTSKPFKSMKNHLIPVPIRKGKAGMAEIIARMKSELPFLDKVTIESVIRVFNQKAIEMVTDGYNVDTGLVYLRPMITGTTNQFELDAEENKLIISAMPGKALRREAAETKIKLTRRNIKVKGIWFVNNATEKNKPMSETGLVRVTGINVKIMGDFPVCGLWFYNTKTKQSYHLDQQKMFDNYPKSLLFVLPHELPAGTYTLKLVTCYCGTSRLLVNPVEYPYTNTVEILPAI